MLFCDNCIPHGQVTLTQQPDEVASIPTPTISLGVTYTYDTLGVTSVVARLPMR